MNLKSHHQLIAKNGNVGEFISKFNKDRMCPIPYCGQQSVGSHSISDKYIRLMADTDNNVFHVPIIIRNNKSDEIMETKSTHDVSVFYGFCSGHEKLFDSLENFPGLPDANDIKKEQVILMSLRAIANRDYYNTLLIESAKQHDKYAEYRYKDYANSTKHYLNVYMKAIDDPSLIDWFEYDMPQDLYGNFLCASYDSGISVVTMPLSNGILRAYISTTMMSRSKLSICWNNPRIIVKRALNNNICVAPLWWNLKTTSEKEQLYKYILAGKKCQTVDYQGSIREFTIPPRLLR